MSDQVTERGGVFGRTADKARDAARRAGRWSDDHVPGGQRVLWIGLGLILLVLLVIWLPYPSPNSTSRRGQFGGPHAVGVAKVTTAI